MVEPAAVAPVAAGGARELTRRAVRAQVSQLAVALVFEQGFDATTVDDICAVAGISRSTFFRYFPTKEAALFGDMADAGTELLAALQARPEDEAPWVALRRASDPLIDRYLGDPAQALRFAKLITGTPTLAAWHREKNAHEYELLRPELARRLGIDAADASDPRVSALLAAALGCVDAAVAAWVEVGEEARLGDLLDRAMGAIASA
ncbi:TetR family transcriptional regulator [Agromyces protaetiae]|uniref:TetR family transcriptional regulator n=1 Tax=Agromyces protaetiae TaxID=2509455 RepID=A0A4P6F8Q8_9MICO|nr:TetR family transcriptional regulator [Agromyces protaetiae]QAY72490.1 TetR family transcriptional regulator [Agromyces protaetiae]